MAQMQRSKVGSRKKGRRSSKDKPYYAAYRLRYPGKLIRRKADRERRIKLAREKPHIGSPSQLRQRMKKGLLQRSPLFARIEKAIQDNEMRPSRVGQVPPGEVSPD